MLTLGAASPILFSCCWIKEKVTSPAKASFVGKILGRGRPMGPLGAVVFFFLAVFAPNLIAHGLRALSVHNMALDFLESEFQQLLVLPLAVAFFPQVFQRRFWHFPRKTWNWMVGIAVIYAIGAIIGHPGTPVSARLTLWVVLAGPVLEEIARAVLVVPFLNRFGGFWAILVGTALTMLMHNDPLGVFVPMLLLTMMFVSTNCSITATAFGHAFINLIVAVAARINSH